MRNLQINLVMSLSDGFQRALCDGVYRYGRPHRPWGFAFDDRVYANRLQSMGSRGVIGCLTQADVDVLTSLGIPGIDVSYDPVATGPAGRVSVDHAAIGEMAADELVQRGFRQLGFFRLSPTPASDRMREAFERRVACVGAQVHAYDPAADYPPLKTHDPTIHTGLTSVAAWLATLPRPTAVLCVDDRRGLQIVEVCRRCEIAVPGEFAVLGVGDDEMYCRRAFPPLSSIALPAVQVGQIAAQMLDTLMSGKSLEVTEVTLQPTKVVTRGSSDAMATEDRLVVRALQYIGGHVHEGIDVGSVASHLGVNRRTLERRFRVATGRAPHEEISRIRIEQVRVLLIDTDRTLEDIAAACGYGTTARMSLTFKQHYQMPPGAYRRRFRVR